MTHGPPAHPDAAGARSDPSETDPSAHRQSLDAAMASASAEDGEAAVTSAAVEAAAGFGGDCFEAAMAVPAPAAPLMMRRILLGTARAVRVAWKEQVEGWVWEDDAMEAAFVRQWMPSGPGGTGLFGTLLLAVVAPQPSTSL